MRAALTGASGLLGANLAATLLSAGHSVRATRRGSTSVEHLKALPIEWVSAGLGDAGELARAFEGVDVVFHCAAQVGVTRRATTQMVAANIDGTRNVLAAVKRSGAKRLVHCSTVAAIGLSDDDTPCNEDTVYNMDARGMMDGYGATKRAAEQLVQEAVAAGLDAVIASPCFMFGAYDAKPSSGKMIVDVVRGKVPGVTPGKNNFVNVRDVARGMVFVAEKGRRGERYILGGENMTYAEIMARIARAAGTKPPRWKIPRVLAAPAGWFGDLVETLGGEPLITSVTLGFAYEPGFIFSSAKAERELGYTHGPVDAGIAEAIVWFRAHGMLPAL